MPTIVFVSSLLLIVIAYIHRKHALNFKKLKWGWMISAIFIITSTLAWIIYMELFYNAYGNSHWQYYRPNFGVIGPFIGVGFVLPGLFLMRANKDRIEVEEDKIERKIKRLPLISVILGSFITIFAIFSPVTTFIFQEI